MLLSFFVLERFLLILYTYVHLSLNHVKNLTLSF